MAEGCVVAVDLGGTNVRARAYRLSGAEAGLAAMQPSNAQLGSTSVATAVEAVVLESIDGLGEKPLRVGVAVPGHIDDRQGLVRWAPNFLEGGDIWRDVPLKSLLQERLGTPVTLGNDANLAALGEYRFGLGRNSCRCLVMLTLGTGVGGGVVFGSDALMGEAKGPLVLVGGNQGGAELGHICLDRNGPTAGNVAYGALEAYCSARAVVERAHRKLASTSGSRLAAILNGQAESLTPKIVSEAADEGDALALEVWTEVGEHLGSAIGSLINVFAPDVVAIGGQMALAGAPLISAARRTARDVAIPTLYADANIEVATRVGDAGLLGAAALAIEAHQWTSQTPSS